mmetsp:Transcript_16486/g.49366  ORF Transcript_16486/g.49366 Transcript_16486/m.49366 type:complete len:86 (+) Transcript_16486:112-369(+)
MHPHLHVDRHPTCAKEIVDLKRCHEEHPVAKFWGVCNDAKLALDECFRQEKVLKRDINRAKARAERERFRQKMAEVGSPSTAPAQ